ncbi:VOC family protein [uncultured Microbacterium sp.]|uniref:VOC family protein n=1 Tax=uncultured Microbacterium sp. TaxID=191216 RepID=UPI0025F5CDAB|nr:VOC family protein [uncultured Microbacterium sp.]
MTTSLVAYLQFRSSTREAMEFYHSVFGGDLDVASFDDFHLPVDEGEGHLVMHARLRTPRGFVIMASDTPSGMDVSPAGGFSLALTGDEEDVLRGWFAGLAEGGRIEMPVDVPPWGGLYGTLVDRFGVAWMVAVGEAD